MIDTIAMTVFRKVKSILTIILYYRGHPCDKLLCSLHSFEVRSVAKCSGIFVSSRLIAMGEVCGPLMGRGLSSFLKSVRRKSEWVIE